MALRKLSLLLILSISLITIGLSCKAHSGGNSTSAIKIKYHYEPNWKSLDHWKVPKWYQDAVLGIYSHWGVLSVNGYRLNSGAQQIDSGIDYGHYMYIPDWTGRNNYGAYDFQLMTYGPPCKFGYRGFIPLFKAQDWNPNRWAKLYKEAGADFAGTMAVHADGFCMWNTKYQKNNSYDMGPHRDVIGELFKALRKQGLKTVATFHERPADFFNPARRYCPKGVDANNPKYAYIYTKPPYKILNEELLEVVRKYRPDQLWFENKYCGAKYWKQFVAYYYNSAERWRKQVMITDKHGECPGCAVHDVEGGIFPKGVWHWAGYTTPQKERWQKDVPLGRFWAYAKGVGARPVNMLVDGIVDRISLNGVTLFDVAPKADGRIPKAQVKALKKLGKWMSINKEALYAAKPAPFVKGGVDTWKAGDFRFTQKGLYLFAIDLGNHWPSTEGFAKYPKSTPPRAPLRIPGVKPIKGSKITLLGSSTDLPWHVDGNNLVIEKLPNPLPCRYAWSFKIKVLAEPPPGESR